VGGDVGEIARLLDEVDLVLQDNDVLELHDLDRGEVLGPVAREGGDRGRDGEREGIPTAASRSHVCGCGHGSLPAMSSSAASITAAPVHSPRREESEARLAAGRMPPR